jgi:hypothetical protein
MILLGTGCTAFTQATVSALPARDLLLDTQAFPTGWMAVPCASDCSRREGTAIAVRGFIPMEYIPGQVIQNVYALKSVAAAQDKFQEWTALDARQTPPVPELTYRSRIADESSLGCGRDEGVPICRASMRYGNYFISFFFNVDRGEADGHGLKIDQIEPILRAFDARVATRIGIFFHNSSTNGRALGQ